MTETQPKSGLTVTHFSPSSTSCQNGSLILCSWNDVTKTRDMLANEKMGHSAALILGPMPEVFGPLLTEMTRLSATDIEAITGVPPTQASRGELRQYSIPGLYSLGAPTQALRDLYPSLRARGEEQIALLAAKGVSAKIQDLPRPLHVVLDMPGYALCMANLLFEAAAIEDIETLVLRTGSESFFEGADSLDAVLGQLKAKGFRLSALDDQDPDWPVLRLEADPAARRIADLETGLKRLRQGMKAETNARAAAEANASDILKQMKAMTASVAEQDQLLKARDTALAEIRQRLETTDKARSDAEKALADGREAASKLAEERDAARKALAEQAGKLKNNATSLASQRSALDLLEERLARATRDRDEMHLDLRLAIETTTANRADLEDLRAKYTALSDERDSLVDLVQVLTPRLREAADHLRNLPVMEQAADSQDESSAKPSKRKKKTQ